PVGAAGGGARGVRDQQQRRAGAGVADRRPPPADRRRDAGADAPTEPAGPGRGAVLLPRADADAAVDRSPADDSPAICPFRPPNHLLPPPPNRRTGGPTVPPVALAPALAGWLTAAPTANASARAVAVEGATVREALDHLFAEHPQLRDYV